MISLVREGYVPWFAQDCRFQTMGFMGIGEIGGRLEVLGLPHVFQSSHAHPVDRVRAQQFCSGVLGLTAISYLITLLIPQHSSS
jgi:hypothetical protein